MSSHITLIPLISYPAETNIQKKGIGMSTWIDFRALKQALDFAAVLRHYQVEIKAKGKQHHGYCPLPNHNGKKNSASFSAHLEKGIFQCFGCGAKGNVLDFAVLMEKGNPENANDIRKTALNLQRTFNIAQPDRPEVVKRNIQQSANETPQTKPVPKPKLEEPGVIVNAPLDFELKTLDFNHPYLRNRGFSEKTIEDFGLGYCSKGYLSGRMAIPLYDNQDRLVGYAGRITDDKLISDENPKYKFPGGRVRNGVQHEFHKSELLYASSHITSPVDNLVVVEGFPSVWWLTQHSTICVVALMGSSCSETQTKLIIEKVKPSGRVWLMPDGNEAGKRCAESVLFQVSPYRFVRWVKLEQNKQPTDFNYDEVSKLLNLAVT
jgi:DNA primase